MAEVDFTNARIAPYGTSNSIKYGHLNINNGNLFDTSNNVIGTGNYTIMKDTQKQLVVLYRGTFSASGTQFLVQANNSDAPWKVSNISFNNGDTYVFSIKADLICQ